jgi:hypothetical protein
MKKVILMAFMAAAASLMAQTPQQTPATSQYQSNIAERAQAPSYSDLYCSGFITDQNISMKNTVAGGTASPNETIYATGNQVFISGGGLTEGSRYSILRALRDPNRYEPYKGQKAQIAALGQPYAEIGRVQVIALRGPIAIAQVEFTCQNITLGDIAVPFQEHAPVTYRKSTSMERFPAAPGSTHARIVMAREFDTHVGTGQKVYLNVGSNKGVKVGDYFRAVRGYNFDKIDPVDVIATKAPVGDDTQKYPGKIDKELAAQMPVRNLGEMIVLNVTATSATAMITNALESIQVGDEVELEGEAPATASGQ